MGAARGERSLLREGKETDDKPNTMSKTTHSHQRLSGITFYGLFSHAAPKQLQYLLTRLSWSVTFRTYRYSSGNFLAA